MDNKYLNFEGLQKFKMKFEESIKDYVRDTVGLKTDQIRLTFADGTDIDSVIKNSVENNDKIITLKTLSDYHNELNNSVIADIVVENLEDKESKLFSKIDGMIDEKMEWKGVFPGSSEE